MTTYHTKKYTEAVLVKMTKRQKRELESKAKKMGVSASEVIRLLIELE